MAVIIVAAPLDTWLADRVGMRPVIFTGLAIGAAGLVWFSRLGGGGGTLVMWPILLVGLGGGLTLPPCSVSILGATPADKAGAGSALTDASSQVGGALGIAVLGSVLSSAYTHAIGQPAGLAGPALQAVRESLGSALGAAAAVGGPPAAGIVQAARTAFLDAISATMLEGAAIVAVGAVAAVLLLPKRGRAAEPAATAPAPAAPGEEPLASKAD
jgi:MFS transporter, DHA2 family, multidrug resistance protein